MEISNDKVGFLQMADGMVLLLVASNPRWCLAAILVISNDDISGTGRPIEFVFNSSVVFTKRSDKNSQSVSDVMIYKVQLQMS